MPNANSISGFAMAIWRVLKLSREKGNIGIKRVSDINAHANNFSKGWKIDGITNRVEEWKKS